MFHLGTKSDPTSAAELQEGIRAGLAKLFELPDGSDAVAVKGGTFPAIQSLRIDLSGARADTTHDVAKPKAVGPRRKGITAGRVEIAGHPVQIDEASLDLDLTARDVALDFGRDKSGKPLLVLADAKDGQVVAEIAKPDIEALLLSKAGEKAEENGIAIEGADLELTQRGPRSVGVDLRVKARKFLAATLRLTGNIDIDDELNARLSNLTCDGEGAVGKMAVGFLRPHLEEYEGYEVSLMAFSLGDVKLRDLKIQAGDTLKVSAKFGS